MVSKKFTFVILSEETDKSYMFQFNLKTLLILLGLIFIIILGSIFSIYKSYDINHQFSSVIKEYDKMVEERNKVLQMTRDLNRINEMDIYVRNSLGISKNIYPDTLLENNVEVISTLRALTMRTLNIGK